MPLSSARHHPVRILGLAISSSASLSAVAAALPPGSVERGTQRLSAAAFFLWLLSAAAPNALTAGE